MKRDVVRKFKITLIQMDVGQSKDANLERAASLIKVRAIENQCFIAAVNQSGKNIEGVRFFGSSMIVDPWGNILKEGPPRGDALITCEIDLRIVDRIRKQLPALRKIKKSYPLKKYG